MNWKDYLRQGVASEAEISRVARATDEYGNPILSVIESLMTQGEDPGQVVRDLRAEFTRLDAAPARPATRPTAPPIAPPAPRPAARPTAPPTAPTVDEEEEEESGLLGRLRPSRWWHWAIIIFMALALCGGSIWAISATSVQLPSLPSLLNPAGPMTATGPGQPGVPWFEANQSTGRRISMFEVPKGLWDFIMNFPKYLMLSIWIMLAGYLLLVYSNERRGSPQPEAISDLRVSRISLAIWVGGMILAPAISATISYLITLLQPEQSFVMDTTMFQLIITTASLFADVIASCIGQIDFSSLAFGMFIKGMLMLSVSPVSSGSKMTSWQFYGTAMMLVSVIVQGIELGRIRHRRFASVTVGFVGFGLFLLCRIPAIAAIAQINNYPSVWTDPWGIVASILSMVWSGRVVLGNSLGLLAASFIQLWVAERVIGPIVQWTAQRVGGNIGQMVPTGDTRPIDTQLMTIYLVVISWVLSPGLWYP